jgi:hypothetical protein
MSPIVRMTVERERMEGNFRFRHAIIRTRAESLVRFIQGILKGEV